jgi:hypothetical protein
MTEVFIEMIIEPAFDLLIAQENVRNTLNQAGLFNMFNSFSNEYDKGRINKRDYEEIRDQIFERLRYLESIKNSVEGAK